MDITLSIIIPYYNAEPYMTELMKVLIPQLTAKVEIIVVDDGSETPYEAPDERIKVVRQKNKGLAGARNAGLEHANGKYISFIDADDIISGYFVEYVLSRSDEEWDYMDLSWKSLEDNRYVYRLKSDSDKLPNPSVCTKVWSRSFIGNLRFNENKDVAEDEDFTRRIDLSRGKRICATQFMYYYRVSTPNSLSKKYRSGTTKTKRIIYYFNHIPEDKALLEEVKRESETNEVVIMSNYENDEFKKYAQIISPIGTWADELRGDATNLVKVRGRVMETQVIIYINNAYVIGGIETFIYNFCQTFYQDYDITVLYGNQMATEQISRLSKIVSVIHNDTKNPIKCDSLIMNRVFDTIPKNITYKQCFQMVHGCFDANPHHLPVDKGKIICVSETVKKSFKDEAKKATVIKNIVPLEQSKDMLLLVSASRFDTPEKGQSRAIKLANMLDREGVPYIWLYFSNRELPGATKNMIKMDPTLDIRKYMRKADYLVQLSDSEAFCYSLVEALIEGTPVITTPLPVLSELGVRDGENAHVIPFDMEFDVQKLMDIPIFSYTYNNKSLITKWKRLLGNTTPTHSYNPEEMVNVKIIIQYTDMEMQRRVYPGEVWPMKRDRALQVEGHGFGKIIGG